MATIAYNNGLADNDMNADGNYAGGTAPGASDTGLFDATSDTAATATANLVWGGLATAAAYGSTVNLAGYDLTLGSAGLVLDDADGTFQCGTGAIDITGGPCDLLHAGTFTPSTGTITINGISTVTSGSGDKFGNLVIAASADVTITGAVYATAAITIGASASIGVASGQIFGPFGASTCTLADGATVSGAGSMIISAPSTGAGITSMHAGASITVAVLQYNVSYSDGQSPELAQGTYAPTLFEVTTTRAVNQTFQFATGTTTFTGNVGFKNTAANDLEILGTANNPDLVLQGDVIWTNTGGGTITYTAGSGGITFSGTADQSIDFGGETPEAITINKTVGELDLTSGDFSLGANAVVNDLVVSGDADLDLDTFDVDFEDGGNCTFSGSGTILCGSGTITITNGDLRYSGFSGTWTRETAIWVFEGASDIVGTSAYAFGATTFSGTHSVSGFVSYNAVIVNGTVSSVASLLVGYAYGSLVLGASGQITGAGMLVTCPNAAGRGLITFPGTATIDIATLQVQTPAAAAIGLPAGTYESAVIITDGNNAGAWNLALNGTYVFDSLEFTTLNAGSTLTIANNTNNPDMTVVGNLILDVNAGTVAVVGGTGDWILQGDVTNQIEAGATCTWTASTGTITASGTAAQDWDWGSVTGAIEAVTVNKAAETLTFSGGVTMASFTQTLGGVDWNGQTLETTGDWAINGGTVSDPAGSAITVGGDFTSTGVDLAGTAAWTLDVAGAGVITGGITITNCDASGSAAPIVATGCIDGGGNVNINFEGAAGHRSRSRHCLSRSRS